MFSVYVLENDWNKKIYIGQSEDLETRVKQHNGLLPSRGNNYTKINKGKGTWIVVYKEEYPTRQEAVKREAFLKSHVGRDFLKIKLGR